MAVSHKEMRELTQLSDSVKALIEQSKQANKKLDALIALQTQVQRGVATTGTLIPAQAQDQEWLRKIGQLCNRSKGRKTDVIVVYYHPQLLVNSKHCKSE
jgi:hypothetical protein